MKKLMILALSLSSVGGMFAQEQALKEADRAMKVEVIDHQKVRALIKPTMTDPSTKDNAQTWYLAGKNELGTWADSYEALRRGENANKASMSTALINGYNYFMTALPLDTVVDAKGKVKTKWSKDIVKALAENHENFYTAGAFLYEEKDPAGAYNAWEIYTSLPYASFMGKMAPAAPGDSIEAENYYNMGMFAYMAENFPNALTSFKKAIAKGYPTADAYNNALAVANQLGDTDEVLALAQGAYNQYGSENPAYLGMMVNAYIERGERDKAMQKLQDGIEANPTDYNLYYTKGIMIESSVNDDTPAEEADKANDEAYACYAKAIELKPDDALSQYQYGRITANKAYKISDNASTLSNRDYNKVRDEQIIPLFRQAVEHLEKAYSIDAEAAHNALPILRNLYYNLQDETNLKRIESLM
jgi:hypothetical protein